VRPEQRRRPPELVDVEATEGKSVEVNLDVAGGNIALAGEIANAWSARSANRG
jgi:pseudouridine-5'-phosphate glycosidase